MNNSLNIPRLFTEMRRAQKKRHRDIALELGISEAELIAAHSGVMTDDDAISLRAVRLQARWPDLIKTVETLGKVMALTRNEACVHEKKGVYHHSSVNGQTGLVLAGDIDLRIFYQHWSSGFAVQEELADGTQRSLQFFDRSGMAIHKIFLQPESNLQAFDALIMAFADDHAAPLQIQAAAPRTEAGLPDNFDNAAFRDAWRSLRDTHDFFSMLRQFKISRTLALREAGVDYAEQLDTAVASDVLLAAAQEQVPIMVFTGNAGMIQIHSGPVSKVLPTGPWINVLDAGFNLHLRTDLIAEAWIVRKPTTDGLVCSLELFDAHGELICMLFGERKPGQAERCEWRGLLDQMRTEHLLCKA
jgi:putative hemin transport protein